MVEWAQTHRQEPRAFWLRGRLDKLINLCLLPPALFLDMQTLPSSKARGIRWADRTSRVWLLPGPEAWPDAGTCARGPAGPCPSPWGLQVVSLPTKEGSPQGRASALPLAGDVQLPWGLGADHYSPGPLLRAEGGPGSQNFGINFPSNPLPFPGLASPGKL